MCGIAGVFYRDQGRSPEASVLRQMGQAIAHRGPDGVGTLRRRNAGLVHRRLAIIDLEGGRQPISNEDNSIHVVFNGEIYNYRELRQTLEERGHQFRTGSDTEVLVHLYEDHGADMCRLLRGMFAFAILDERAGELLLARDHLGQKPLFIYRDDEKLLFGSELKAILAHPNVDNRLQPTAIDDYLTFGFVPGHRCILKAAEKLPAAHYVTVSCENWHATPERYWQLQFGHEESRSVDDWTDRIDAAIKDSVKAHLVSDVPVGAFLSGGLDSGAIVSTVADLTSTPLQTFSIGFEERKFSELPEAEAVANYFGCRHTTMVVTPHAVRDLDELVFLYDEPFADASAIPTMAVSKLASEHVKVVLSGDGGDELFGGYSRYLHDLKEAALREALPFRFRSTVLQTMSQFWPRADWLPRPLRLRSALQNLATDPATAYANTLSNCRGEARAAVWNNEFQQQLAGHDPGQIAFDYYRAGARDALSGMLSADTNLLLPDDFLTKVDRASMGYGLEVRPPFVDRPLMELAAAMPSDLKVRNGTGKWILKRLFESRLPDRHVSHRKRGFEIPLDGWLRGPLRNQVQDVVLDERAPLAEMINTRHVRQLYSSHLRRTANHGQLIWSLLVLGRWLDRWHRTASAPSVSREFVSADDARSESSDVLQEVSA